MSGDIKAGNGLLEVQPVGDQQLRTAIQEKKTTAAHVNTTEHRNTAKKKRTDEEECFFVISVSSGRPEFNTRPTKEES